MPDQVTINIATGDGRTASTTINLDTEFELGDGDGRLGTSYQVDPSEAVKAERPRPVDIYVRFRYAPTEGEIFQLPAEEVEQLTLWWKGWDWGGHDAPSDERTITLRQYGTDAPLCLRAADIVAIS